MLVHLSPQSPLPLPGYGSTFAALMYGNIDDPRMDYKVMSLTHMTGELVGEVVEVGELFYFVYLKGDLMLLASQTLHS